MKLLVIGSGGREHALAWHLAKTSGLQKIFVAPGNAGTAHETELENINLTDPVALADFAEKEEIQLTVVGPEAPLAAGIVNIFRARGLKIFGPTREAAQLESSKDFAKRFMARHGIPTAAFETFSDAAAAHAHIDAQGAPIVIKADGLAAGKGVVVAMTLKEAHDAIDHMLAGPGARVVIEEFLDGEEASFIVMVDGKNVLALASSQDHKRIGDGDTGPNTGGMGAYSPAPVVTPAIHAKAMREIILPTVRGMAADGIPYTGFLYAGLMIGKDGSVKTVEFNCRMGDPETQPIMMRLKSDLLPLLEHAVAGKLDQIEADWDRRVALGVVLAAANYPATPRLGDVISGLPANGPDLHVFHAGTAQRDGRTVTSGGRVLCVTALGDNVRQAQKRAYEALIGIHFDGMQYRRDIGHRATAPQATARQRHANAALTTMIAASTLEAYFRGLQQHIVRAAEAVEGERGGRFLADPWQKEAGSPLGGKGLTCIIEGGRVFERGGVAFSHVTGPALPASATAKRPELAGRAFEAMGVSLVLHPHNPFCPTAHMNVRALIASKPGEAPVGWFGGGMDLTPCYPHEEDIRHFHGACKRALTPFGDDVHARYKRWCDEYFFLKHRNEPRGVGGIFFDDLNEGGEGWDDPMARCFALTCAVGDAFCEAYLPIVEKRQDTPYGERERDFQAYRRGRYVEFNLVWDRGTLFGLQSGGRTESILMSLPPVVKWRYDWNPEPGSPEALLYEMLPPRDWV